MNISNKIGTCTVTIATSKPNIRLINYLTMNHVPLTPDLFQTYAGTWTEDTNNDEVDEIYEDWILNQQYEALEDAVENDETSTYNDARNSFVDMNATSSIYDSATTKKTNIDTKIDEAFKKEKAHDLALLEEMQNEQIKEMSSKFDNVSLNQQEKVHENLHNDLNANDKVETLNIKQPVLNTVTNNNDNDVNFISSTNITDKPTNIQESITEESSLPNIGHEPKFISKAKNDNEYYDSVVTEYSNYLNKK